MDRNGNGHDTVERSGPDVVLLEFSQMNRVDFPGPIIARIWIRFPFVTPQFRLLIRLH